MKFDCTVGGSTLQRPLSTVIAACPPHGSPLGYQQSKDTPFIQSLITQYTMMQRDLSYLKTYVASVYDSLDATSLAFLKEKCPYLGQGTYTSWNQQWVTADSLATQICAIRRQLMASGLWVNEAALDAYVLITCR